MTRQSRAFAYAISTVLLWSTVASAFKLSLRYLDPLQLLFYANLTSVLTLFLVLLLQRKLPQLLALDKLAVLRSGLLGILNPFLYYLVLFKAYDLLPAQEAQPLNYTWAITLSLLSIPFLGQRLAASELAAILLSYLGVLIIATHGDVLGLRFSNTLGVFLALGSTLIWASYWLIHTRSKVEPVIGLFLNFLFALPLIGAVTWLSGGLVWPAGPGLAGAVYVGIFEMGVAFVLWLQAMRLTSSTARIASLIYFSPFISLILIHYVVGEEILWSSAIGLFFIVLGTLLQQAFHRKQINAPS